MSRKLGEMQERMAMDDEARERGPDLVQGLRVWVERLGALIGEYQEIIAQREAEIERLRAVLRAIAQEDHPEAIGGAVLARAGLEEADGTAGQKAQERAALSQR